MSASVCASVFARVHLSETYVYIHTHAHAHANTDTDTPECIYTICTNVLENAFDIHIYLHTHH